MKELINGLTAIELFDIKLIEVGDVLELLLRFTFNFFVCYIIIWFFYHKKDKRSDYLFTFFMLSVVIFLLIYLLDSVKMNMGFALGLFAIFGIIRYRTDPIPIKEMTYLFVIIGVSVINAMVSNNISYTELFLTNALLICVLFFLEKTLNGYSFRKTITYEKIDLIKPQNYNEMLADLKERTGLNISKAVVGTINFLGDTAEVVIYYKQNI